MRNCTAILRAEIESRNTEAATVVLASPERYGGELAALVQWARIVLDRKSELQSKVGER
jgi:hypothetical protein